MRALNTIVATLLMAASLASSAAALDLAWIGEVDRYPATNDEATETAARLQALADELAGSPDPALLADLLTGQPVLALEQLARSEYVISSQACRARNAAFDAASALGQVAKAATGNDGQPSLQWSLPGPGFWLLDGTLPAGAVAWSASCPLRIHPAADPCVFDAQPPLWRTRIVDEWRRTITVHGGGTFGEQLVVSVPAQCTQGAEVSVRWEPLPAVKLDSAGAPLHHMEQELALRKSCEQIALGPADQTRCLTRKATEEWMQGIELGRHETVLVGFPILVDRFRANAADPTNALDGVNTAFLDGAWRRHFPGCEDMIVTDLLELLNGLEELAEHGQQLTCDNAGMRPDGSAMPMQVRQRAMPTTAPSSR